MTLSQDAASDASPSQLPNKNQEDENFERRAKALFDLSAGLSSDQIILELAQDDSASRQQLRESYLNLFDFSGMSLVDAMRALLEKFYLAGETQVQDRMIKAFAGRYCRCNPGTLPVDRVHILAYALILLNTDLHSMSTRRDTLHRKMNAQAFIENTLRSLQEHPDSEPDSNWRITIDDSFLREIYESIRKNPFTLFSSPATSLNRSPVLSERQHGSLSRTPPALANEISASALKRICKVAPWKVGRLIRKHVRESWTTPASNRQWIEFSALISGSDLCLFETETSVDQMMEEKHLLDVVPLRHAVASPLPDGYSDKRQMCFQLITWNGNLFVFETSQVDEWVSCINWWAALESRVSLAVAVGSACYGFEKSWCMGFFPGGDEEAKGNCPQIKDLSDLPESNRKVTTLTEMSIETWKPPRLPFVPASKHKLIDEVSFEGEASKLFAKEPLGVWEAKLMSADRQVTTWKERMNSLVDQMKHHLEVREIQKYLGIGKGIQGVIIVASHSEGSQRVPESYGLYTRGISSNDMKSQAQELPSTNESASNNESFLAKTKTVFRHYKKQLSRSTLSLLRIDEAPERKWSAAQCIETASRLPLHADFGHQFSNTDHSLTLPPRTSSLQDYTNTLLETDGQFITLPPPSNLIVNNPHLPRCILQVLTSDTLLPQLKNIFPNFSDSVPSLAHKINENWETKFNFLQWEICKARWYIFILQKGVTVKENDQDPNPSNVTMNKPSKLRRKSLRYQKSSARPSSTLAHLAKKEEDIDALISESLQDLSNKDALFHIPVETTPNSTSENASNGAHDDGCGIPGATLPPEL